MVAVLSRRSLLPLALALGGLLVAAAPSPAPVAPRDCGRITVESRTYQIKADQIRCSTAKTWSRRHLRSNWEPRGYSCRNYRSGTALKFRCRKRARVFFAIRR